LASNTFADSWRIPIGFRGRGSNAIFDFNREIIDATVIPDANRGDIGSTAEKAVLYASDGEDFADAARSVTLQLREQINVYRTESSGVNLLI
tara:strand:+ start:4244 stop:4519 length:276 start_codon:yes stop_codon:yes gene_type:complete